MNKFTKADLKPGMIVETRNGNRYIAHEFNGTLILARNRGWLGLLKYEDDLLRDNIDDNQFDIMIIRKPKSKRQLVEACWKEAPIIWERKESPKTTEFERVILRNLDIKEEYSWLTRDKNGLLTLHNDKPGYIPDLLGEVDE